MKIGLQTITVMFCFCFIANCEAQEQKKDNNAVCEKAEECKSNVCSDKKCAKGTQKKGICVDYTEECASGSSVLCSTDGRSFGPALKCE